MKKIIIFILAVCLLAPCASLLTYAANEGRIELVDYTGNNRLNTGTVVGLKGALKRQAGTWGEIEIKFTYDATMLEFQDSEGVELLSEGTLVYKGDASGDNGNRKEFVLNFKPLKAGTTVLTVKEASVKDKDGNAVDYPAGATGTIEIVGETVAPTVKEEPSAGVSVQVQGKQYQLVAEFPEKEMPAGFTATEIQYGEEKYNGAYSTHYAGLKLAYLTDEEGKGRFFIYDEAEDAFSPFEMLQISDITTIVLLFDVDNVKVPDGYEKTTVTSPDGWNLPAWQNKDQEEGYCIIYALNNNEERVLYQVDYSEHTYQKFTMITEETQKEVGLSSKLGALFENHLEKVILGAAVIVLIFLIVIIVLSVKLYNRNAELDEIYDEYGLDEDEDADKNEDDFDEDFVLDLSDFDDEEVEEAEAVETIDEVATTEGEKEVEILIQPAEVKVDEDPVIEEPKEIRKVESDLFLQAGMQELFPSATEETDLTEEKLMSSALEEIESSLEDKEKKADTLGVILEQQKQTKKEEEYDELLENFSLDFIDLDD